jgi:hypothetical protein
VLIPIVRGWSVYYRKAASSREFAGLDHYLWAMGDAAIQAQIDAVFAVRVSDEGVKTRA